MPYLVEKERASTDGTISLIRVWSNMFWKKRKYYKSTTIVRQWICEYYFFINLTQIQHSKTRTVVKVSSIILSCGVTSGKLFIGTKEKFLTLVKFGLTWTVFCKKLISANNINYWRKKSATQVKGALWIKFKNTRFWIHTLHIPKWNWKQKYSAQ